MRSHAPLRGAMLALALVGLLLEPSAAQSDPKLVTYISAANAIRQGVAEASGTKVAPLEAPEIDTTAVTAADVDPSLNISSSGLPYVKLPAQSPPFAKLPAPETYKSNFPITNPGGTELSSSLVFVAMDELRDHCASMAKRAAAGNGKKILLVPTVHWVGTVNVTESWCFRTGFQCDPVTDADIATFTTDMLTCTQAAIDAGFTEIHVLPHNDIKDNYVWRNSLDFKPFAKYGGYSYYDVLVSPVADALKAAMDGNPGIKVYLTLQGETGMSVFKYTKDWIQAMSMARAQLTGKTAVESSRPNYKSNVKVGISLNYDKICMCLDFAPLIGGLEYASRYPGEWNKAYKTLNLDFPAIKELYASMEFVGISAYTALPPGAPVSDLELSLIYHDVELSLKGVPLADIVTKQGMELVISEWGFGGGYLDGNSISPDAEYLVNHPFYGMWGTYNKAKDPWSNPTFQAIRLETYKKAAIWLKQQGGPTYRVSSLFQWNGGSWDVQGIRYDSVGWANKDIMAVIAAHNKAVNSA